MPDVPQPFIPDGSVIITPKQQYDELQALTKAVNALSAKVDPTLVTYRQDIDESKRDITEIRAELNGLQKWRYTLTGAVLLLSALLGWGVINFAKFGA